MPTDAEVRAELAHRLDLIRQARGWGDFLRLVERIRRRDAGDPVVRLERDRVA